MLPSLKLTWHLQGSLSKRKIIVQSPVFRCYVSFREGNIRRPLALAKGERAQKFAAVMLESCCCSGVSHRLLHGTTARLRTVWLGHYFRLLHGIWRCGILVSDPASQRGCWPQEMFYGFQRWREAFFLACVFGLPELGLLWCLAFSDPLPTSFIFVSVQVIGCLSATVLYLCFFLRLRSCSFGTVWKGCERIVFGLPELGL